MVIGLLRRLFGGDPAGAPPAGPADPGRAGDPPAGPADDAPPHGGPMCAALTVLSEEVEALRRDPPPYVSRIGIPRVPTFVVDDNGTLKRPPGEGPWDLTVSVRGGVLTPEKRATYEAAIDGLPELKKRAESATAAVKASERLLGELRKKLGKAAGDAAVDADGEVVAERDGLVAKPPGVHPAGANPSGGAGGGLAADDDERASKKPRSDSSADTTDSPANPTDSPSGEASGVDDAPPSASAMLPSVGTWIASRCGGSSAAAAAGICPTGACELDALAEAQTAALAVAGKHREAEREVLLELRSAEDMAATWELADAYDLPFRFGIRFGVDWPRKPPEHVQFQCVIHHALTDDEECIPNSFFKRPPEGSKTYTLLGLLETLHGFLVDPLGAMEIPLSAMPKRYHESVRVHSLQNAKRLATIRKYGRQVRHPALFANPLVLQEEWFVPSFWQAAKENTPEAWRAVLKDHLAGEVFSFEMFSEPFCKVLVEEIFNFYESGLPARRPNSMNNYGIILNEIGLEPLIDELQRLLQPLGRLLWPGPGDEWDSHHCFIVRYREGEDLGLDMHTDDSDVTFNICLGLDFDGAGLQFCGLMGAGNHRKHTFTFKHVKGTCVCHLGRKRHGADDISTGERLNLILWNHSKNTYRLSTEYLEPPFTKEEGPPDQLCLSYTHDRDYGVFKEYPKGKEKHKNKGWCPPKAFQYDDFKCEKSVSKEG